MTNDTWGRVQQELLKRIGKNNYTTWIEPLKLTQLKNGVASFEVPSQFHGNWVSRNYSDQIQLHLADAGASVERLEFVAGLTASPESPKKSAVRASSASSPKARVNGHEDVPGAPLDARFTFESFVVGKPNELAHAAARRVAEGGPVSFNPLFLYGGVGLGKTHLMHAIAHDVQQRQPHLRVLYLSAEIGRAHV